MNFGFVIICIDGDLSSEIEIGKFELMKSQNHRMVGIGRDLCGSSSPTLLLKQGHLEQAVEDLAQAGLEYLQRRRLIKPR